MLVVLVVLSPAAATQAAPAAQTVDLDNIVVQITSPQAARYVYVLITQGNARVNMRAESY